MSIFKETLDPGIQTQLKARTLVVSGENNNRSGLLPWYLSKNAWVRMTSFVNFTEGTIYFDGVGSVKVDPTTGHYKGDKLSKKYILEGGTLNTNLGTSGNQTLGSLRYGVATANAVYGSNIDLRTDGTADPNYFRQLGLRPMPGITDVKMRTIGAYGSLFETTVNFHAWDTHQLNELEILFMRPGYSVLLEWGWSQYLDYKNADAKNTLTQEQISPAVFNGQTINPFNTTLTPENVYKELERLRKHYHYNYDGMLGYVKNFNWKLRRDGGYDCSTTLISMGEAINTIKMNTSANQTILGQNKIPDGDEASSYVYDDYENVLLSLKSNVEIPAEGRLEDNGVIISEVNTYISESAYFGNWEQNINYIKPSSIRSTLVENGYTEQANLIANAGETGQPYAQKIENTSDTNYGTQYEYLTLDVVLAIISSYTNIKARSYTNKNEPSKNTNYQFVKIIVPTDNDFCLAGRDSISVQPSICNVYNPGAFKEEIKYFKFPGGGTKYDPTKDGVIPTIWDYQKNFYDPAVKAGRINRILVNIDLLLNVYKDLKGSSNESGVVMTDYLKNVLNKISNALGGLNNFSLSTAGRDQNTLRIIDTYYFGQERKDNTYQFDLLGLGSICKDVSIQSQIFQEQSTIVAIAAQSKANLGDVYNSTQVYLNAGLEDRLALAKWQGSEIDATSEVNPDDDPFYIKLAQLMVYARSYLIGYTSQSDRNGTIKVADSGEDPHTLLKQALLRYDGEMNFKALIPFKLRITLEGIGGIVVGQIFTVKQNVLPKNYYDKRLGFIVTQIEHVLNNNQWETVLDTQICILDQQDFYDASGLSKLTNNIKRKGFGEALLKRQILGIIWPVLIDFMIYQATRAYVGYIYAMKDYYSFLKNSGAGITRESLGINYDLDVIEKYWKNNVSLFTNRVTAVGSSQNVSQSPLSQNSTKYSTTNTDIYHNNGGGFESFFLKWFEIWKIQNDDRLNNRYSENKTIGDVVEFVTNKGYLINQTDPEYKNFKLFLDEAKNFVSTFDTNILVAIKESPIYGGGSNNPKIDDILEISQITSPRTFYSVLGWKKQTLVSRIESFILSSGNSKFNTIKSNYNSPLVTNLREYFTPNSSVMYNESTSMTGIKNVNLNDNSTLDIIAFDSNGTEAQQKVQYWANSIDWTPEYTIVNRYIETYDPRLDVSTFSSQLGGSTNFWSIYSS